MENENNIVVEDAAAQAQQERAFKKKYALSHFIVTAVAYGLGCILFKSLITGIIVYLISLYFIPKVIKVFESIGWYEAPDQSARYINSTKIVDGKKYVYYGGLGALWDSLVGVVGGLCIASIPVVVLYFLVPISIIIPLVGGIVVYLLLNMIVFPLFQDVVWFFSWDELDAKLENIYTKILLGVVALSLVAAVVYPIYSVSHAKATMDTNEILAAHFEEREQENPYENVDLSNAKVEYSKFATKANVVYDEPIDAGNGWVYSGCSFEFKYVVNKWTVISHSFDEDPTYRGAATYTTEGPFEMKGYSGEVKVTLTVSALEDDGSGSGNLCVTDLQTGEEVYATDFAFGAERNTFGNAVFKLATELQMKGYKRDYCYFNFGGEKPAKIVIGSNEFTFENP